jgi:hypothetical protein
MGQALATGKYDLVIVSFEDAGAVRGETAAIEPRPLILPVVYKPTRQQEAEARSTYTCVLRPEKMNSFQALAEIDRLFDLQAKGRGDAGGRR